MRTGVTTVCVILLVVVAAVGSGQVFGSAGSQRSITAQGDGSPIVLEASDLYFEPEELTFAVGDTIVLHNTGVLEHNFAIEGYNDDAPVDMPIGEEIEWTVPDDLEPGTYTFYCAVPGHRPAGMSGTLTVEAADGNDDRSTPDVETQIAELEEQVAAQATQIADLEARLEVLEAAPGE